MSARSSWRQRHPFWLAASFGTRERLRRLTSQQATGVVVSAVLGAAALVALVLGCRNAVPGVLRALREQSLMLFVIGALPAFIVVSKRVRLAAARWPRHWLAAAPISADRLRLARALQALWPMLALLVAVVVVVLLFGSVAGAVRETWVPLAFIAIGAVAGSMAALLKPVTAPPQQREASRYAFPGADRQPRWQASIGGLSRWPIMHAIATGRPKNSRILFVVAMFAVPSGASMLQGLAIVSLWVLVAYLGSLLAALVAVSWQAGDWLRSTPIGFVKFGWSLVRRFVLHQVAGTLLLAVCAIATQASLAKALYLPALWLTVVATVSAIALSNSYRQIRPHTSIVASVAILASIEAWHAFGSVPVATLLIIWHIRCGMKQ